MSTIEYTDAIYDEGTGAWISSAEVAEIPFTALSTLRKIECVPDVWWYAGSGS